jgi:NADPH:quinone reductase-like Zn-dependent oxidoreductase
MRLLVCGGRNYAKWCPIKKVALWSQFIDQQCVVWGAIKDKLDSCSPAESKVIISGGATGVDSSAIDFADAHYIECEIYPADWDKLGKRAGLIRNQQMLDEGKPDHVLAIMGGNGTADMVRRAEKAGIPVTEIK